MAAGAFGAHALRNQVSAEDLEVWRTGAQYLLTHAVALVAIGLSGAEKLRLPAMLLMAGSLIFSLSLFVLVLADFRWLGAVTPLGGVLMIAGWVAVGVICARGTIRE